jgi:hypothetical protein
MNRQNLFRILLSAATVVLTAGAHADYSTTFNVPPYQLDATILGIEGWEPRMPGGTDQGLSARVCPIRWNKSVPALVLRKASIKNAFPKTEGQHVKVTVKVALAFPRPGAQLQQFRLGISGAPFGEIVFDAGPEGGLGFGDGGGRKTKVVLPRDEVKMNSFYTFSILVDYDAMTYDVNVTGIKYDGTPFLHETKGLPIETTRKSMDSMLILTGAQINAYVGEISIQSL